MSKAVLSRAVLLVGSLLLGSAAAQSTLDKTTQSAIIGKLAEVVEARYVFPDKGKAMAESILVRRRRGAYDEAMTGVAFSALVSEHLQEVSHDKHLRVSCQNAPLPPRPAPPASRTGFLDSGAHPWEI
jgi:hypothetical protein